MLDHIKVIIGRQKLLSMGNVLKFTSFGALVSISRFVFMFYFSTIDKSNQGGVADIVFINGNNALFISLYLTLVLIPLAQFKSYNVKGILFFLFLSIGISFGWTQIYNYPLGLTFLTIWIMLANITYETARRVLFISNEKLVVKLDLIVACLYGVLLILAFLLDFDIYLYLKISSCLILAVGVVFILNNKNSAFREVSVKEFFRLNHSGVGQSLLAFLAGNFIFQLISFSGNEKVFTKVNIIRIWTAPVGLLLNGLDFVYSRDEYKGKIPSAILLLTIGLSLVSFFIIDNETIFYLLAFFFVVPFQFWLRETQIKLRQSQRHANIWRMNILFTLLSLFFSWVLVSWVSWEYWSWYLIIVYIILWLGWKTGKITD